MAKQETLRLRVQEDALASRRAVALSEGLTLQEWIRGICGARVDAVRAGEAELAEEARRWDAREITPAGWEAVPRGGKQAEPPSASGFEGWKSPIAEGVVSPSVIRPPSTLVVGDTTAP